MSREAYHPPDLSRWLCGHLKLIAFTVAPQHRTEQRWWADLVGTEPDESVRRKDAFQEAGPYGDDKRLTLTIDLFRVQWAWEPVISTTEQFLEGVQTLGTFVEQKDAFVTRMTPWLARAPEVKRLGFAANLVLPVATPEEGYVTLNQLLPTVEVDPRSSDFLYRINRTCPSRVQPGGGTINRLATWVPRKVTAKVFAPGTEDSAEHVVGEGHYISLDLDVNTHQARTEPFPPGVLGAVWAELAELAAARASRGDERD